MTCHYPDLGSTSDWLKCTGTTFQPIRSTTKIWVVTRHQYGISALVTQTLFSEGSSGDLAKRRLFCQATAHSFLNFKLNKPRPKGTWDAPKFYSCIKGHCNHKVTLPTSRSLRSNFHPLKGKCKKQTIFVSL